MRSLGYILLVALSVCLLEGCKEQDSEAYQAEIEKAWVLGQTDTVRVSATEFSVYAPLAMRHTPGKMLGFTLSEGASASIRSGEVEIGEEGLDIHVTSPNGRVARDYRVSVQYYSKSFDFDFEQWLARLAGDPNKSYWTPKGGWASANPSFSIVKSKTLSYPTRRTSDAHGGDYAVEMVTRKMPNLPFLPALAAGSVFLGHFDAQQAMSHPKRSLILGYPYLRTDFPLRFEGWYTYTPGTEMIDPENQLEGKDKATMYAVLFRGPSLTAEDIFTSPRVLAIAKTYVDRATPGYEFFSVDFDYRSGKPQEIPQNAMLTIVFSSSYRGQDYIGAVGSTLRVDDVRIVTGEI